MPQATPDTHALYRRQIDYTMSVANALLDGTSRVEKLLIETTRDEIQSRYALLKAMTETDTSNGIGSIQAAFLRDKPSDLVHLQSELMQIAQDTQQAVAQSIEVLELGDDATRIDPFGPWLSALGDGSQWRSGSPSGSAPAGSGEPSSDPAASPLGPIQGLIDLWRNQMTATIKAFDSGIDQMQQQGRAAMQAVDETRSDGAVRSQETAHASKRAATKTTRKDTKAKKQAR